ncbi:Ribosome biogenesis protein WDR12-like protein [Aphelenchoides fujianensis]|nr:Ribosome biogenesis protein WDR12-like protein [Aphelenchoides fujianensis]
MIGTNGRSLAARRKAHPTAASTRSADRDRPENSAPTAPNRFAALRPPTCRLLRNTRSPSLPCGQSSECGFVSNDSRAQNVPRIDIDVPAEIEPSGLNELVNLSGKSANESWEDVSFSFLINGQLLRTSLLEFVTANTLSTESVLEIECILQEEAPIPDQSLEDDDWIGAVHTTRDWIYSANYGGSLNVWSRKGKKVASRKFKEESLRCVRAFNTPNGEFVVCGGEEQTLTVCKKEAAELLPLVLLRGHERSIECVGVNADGSCLVSGGFDKCIKIWRLDQDDTNFTANRSETAAKRQKSSVITKIPLMTLETHRDAVMDVEWLPTEENRVLTASWDQTLILWDVEAGSVITTLSCNKAHSRLSINPLSGLVVTASMDAVIRMWDLRSKDEFMIKQRFRGHNGIVSDVHWSPSSENLFVSSSFDATVKMWDIRSPNAPLYDISGHVGHVLAVDWSVDSLIVSAGKDSTIKTYKR